MKLPAIKKDGKRFYLKDDYHLISVTSVLSHFPDFDPTLWYKSLGAQAAQNASVEEQYVLGKRLGEEEKNKQAAVGTANHALIEAHFKEGIPLLLEKKSFSQFIQTYISPCRDELNNLLLEQTVYWLWEELGGGFAGTYDLMCTFKKEFKVYKESQTLRPKRVILDWKNTRSVKYAVGTNRDKKTYYPLTKYFLQLAAYTAAYNAHQPDTELKINETMVVVSPQNRKIVYIYYCDPQKTMFYWLQFKKLLKCYYEGKPFNWDYLNYEIAIEDAVPTRLLELD